MSILEFALKLAHKVRIYFGRYILKMSLIHQKFYSLGEYIYIYINSHNSKASNAHPYMYKKQSWL